MVVDPTKRTLIKDGLRNVLNWSNPVGHPKSSRVANAKELRSDTVCESDQSKGKVFYKCILFVYLLYKFNESLS